MQPDVIVNEVDSLRSPRVKSGVAVGLLSRVVSFLSLFLTARLVTQKMGLDSYGLVGFVASLVELSMALDYATLETAAYETSRATNRHELEETLSRVWELAAVTATVVGGVLLALAVVVPALIGDQGGLPAVLGPMLVAAAVGFPLQCLANVYAGTLHGLGWLRELNQTVIVAAILEFVATLLCLHFAPSLALIQWIRTGRIVVRFGLVLRVLVKHRLPVARPRWITLADLRSVSPYAGTYAASRGLGFVIYRATTALAPVVTTLTRASTLIFTDQLASNLYRLTPVLYESLFPRLARRLRPDATAEDLQVGRNVYIAASLGLSSIVVTAGVGLSVIGPWLIPAWLGSAPPGANVMLPWVSLAWAVNATGGPATCLLLAAAQNRASVIAHAIAVTLNLVLIFTVGAGSNDAGLGIALAATNITVVLILSVLACKRVGFSWATWAARHGLVYGGGGLAYLVGISLPWPRYVSGVLAGALALTCMAPIWWNNAELRSLLLFGRDFVRTRLGRTRVEQ